MNQFKISQNMDQSIKVMHNAGTWLAASGKNPSKWWKPENMNHRFMLQHTEPNEYYVAEIDGKPTASMVLQETERN